MTKQKRIAAGKGTAPPACSAFAYRRWRGERPLSGYGRDLIAWDYEDRDMRRCWDAAVAWAMTQNTTHQARAGSPSPECAGSPLDSSR